MKHLPQTVILCGFLLLVVDACLGSYYAQDISLTPIPGTPEGDAYLRFSHIRQIVLFLQTPLFFLAIALIMLGLWRIREGQREKSAGQESHPG